MSTITNPNTYVSNANKINSMRSALSQAIVVLSLVVTLIVFWCLKLTGITLAGEAFCGMDEHSHGEGCPTGSLVCMLEETEGHVHDESCILRELLCERKEALPHVHNDDCLEYALICPEEEIEPHFHDDECFAWDLMCEEEEQDGHRHSGSCYADQLICTDPEHIHTDDCYAEAAVCGIEEMQGHTHTDACYMPGDDLLCTREETEGHLHTDACFVLVEDSFVCGKEETEGHRHTDECYYIGIGFGCGLTEEEGHVHTEECLTDETELGCGLDCVPEHFHTDACYQALEACPLEEHIHTEDCYSNLDADIETMVDWEADLPDLSEIPSTGMAVAAVANSQLGYTESTLNFEVDLDGIRHGITRYGQWYGNPYGDWSAMFAAFCLHYAGTDELPVNAGPESMRLEWEEEGLYVPADGSIADIGSLLFLRSDTDEEVTYDFEYEYEADAAAAVAIVVDFDEYGMTVIQGDLNDAVEEYYIEADDPAILGYGIVPENSPFALLALPRATGVYSYVAKTINYSAGMFTGGRSFLIYAQHNGQYYALYSQPISDNKEYNIVGVPIEIRSDGSIYADVEDPSALLWNFTANGNNYDIRNVATNRCLHPGGEGAVIHGDTWPTMLRQDGTGAKLIHTSNSNDVGIRFNTNQLYFDTTNKNGATTLYFGVAEQCTVWLDGTQGGLSAYGGSQNQKYTVSVGSQMTLPSQWLSPTKYDYTLQGWYDVTHAKYYYPGEQVTIMENSVFYADWRADTYDIGQYNAHVTDTVSTNSFITTQVFDYTYLFNVLSADPQVTVSDSSHSETWAINQNEFVDYENRSTLDFIFLDYGSGGTLDYPTNRRDGVNQYPGEGIVTGGIYNSRIGEALFSTDDRIPGKVYLGEGDHLFQIMDDPDNEYYGYYYYDSARNAASYNQSAQRFYVYDYLEATSAELSAAKSDFMPFNSPYANTNGQTVATYKADEEHANMTNYVYDAKYDDSANQVSSNYAFGMKIDINFYLPTTPGDDGNKDVFGNDMRFTFSGDDDLWVLVDGKLALDIGGIHQAETGEINFSTGEVLIQGERNETLSQVVSNLAAGEHTLTVMYLERGASHSNCAIYFNLAPRYSFSIQKEDVLTREVLNGAQFSVYYDLECTEPVDLWESQESYMRGDRATNTFTVKNGVVNMWGLGAGNTYYIKETAPPTNTNYTYPNGIIRMILDKKGNATYNVIVVDAGDGISGGFTVHGFRIDEETQQAYIIATNAPKWVNDVTSVEVRKVWNDGSKHSDDAVTVYLTIHDPDGTVRRLQEVELSEELNWQYVWDNLPKYYQDGKTPIVYGVEEAYVSGYYSKVEKVDTYTSTSTQWTATKSLEAGKTYLLQTTKGYLATQNRNEDTGYTWITDAAAAQQSDLALWTVSKLGSGYKLTNKAGQTITFYYNNGNPSDFYTYSGSSLPSEATQELSWSVKGTEI
ncbi:MAG: Cna B-type domain-containing protein, partial [Clostridia bacterium]|nr:Cna B-type domain-containing protein [Clostridia bacterium]